MDRSPNWLLFVYSLPAEPSRLRVRVWRELRRAGAVTLRDGVCALPDGARARAWAERTRALVAELGGAASVARGARLDPASAAALRAQIASARAEEYGEVAAEAEGLREHLAELGQHFRPGRAPAAELRGDVRRLRTWLAQAIERDDLGLADPTAAERAVAACERALDELIRPATAEERSA